MIDADGRQVLYFLLGQAEANAVVDPGHRSDGYGDFLATPHMTLLEEHMGHMVSLTIDHQSLNAPDRAVRRVDLLSSSHPYLVQWNRVVGDGLRNLANGVSEAVVGLSQHLPGGVVGVTAAGRQELGLFGMIELGELSQGAANKDLAGRDIDEIQWHEATETLTVLGLHHQMGDGSGDGIDHDTADLATRTIGTGCFGPDRELNLICHGYRLPAH